MAAPEAPGEPECQAGSPTGRVVALQSPLGAELSAERRLSVFLGVYVVVLGGEVSGHVVSVNDAVSACAPEASRPYAAGTSGTLVERVSC